jgi:hypothetical protein
MCKYGSRRKWGEVAVQWWVTLNIQRVKFLRLTVQYKHYEITY